MSVGQGTYYIQRATDQKYLNNTFTHPTVSPELYSWNVEPVPKSTHENAYHIQDSVSGRYLSDNGKSNNTLDIVPNENSEWFGLSTESFERIVNVVTKQPLTIPWKQADGGKDEWKLIAV